MSRRIGAAPLLIVAFVLSLASRASADEGGDGLYGRFDGDVWLSAAVGAGGVFGDGAARSAGTVELRARFLDSVGPFAFVQGDGLFGDASRWRVGGGLELRPLFLARFLTSNSIGQEWLDVFLDSFSIELGVVALGLGEPTSGALGAQQSSAAFVLGTGLDLPILLGDWRIALRVGLRWTHADQLRSGVQNDLTLLGALVISAPIRAGLAGREGPRAR